MELKDKLTFLTSYAIEAEARLAASLLESAGIHSVVQTRYPVGQAGGAEILVQEKDLKKAKEILHG